MPKYYTLTEANATLKMIQSTLEEMMDIAAKIRENQPELWGLVQKSAGNGGSANVSGTLRKLLFSLDSGIAPVASD